MVIDTYQRSIGTTPGHITIVELKGLSMGYLSKFSAIGFKKFAAYLQEALPVRLKAVHFINTNSVMDIIFNMMKPFMKKELVDIVSK